MSAYTFLYHFESFICRSSSSLEFMIQIWSIRPINRQKLIIDCEKKTVQFIDE